MEASGLFTGQSGSLGPYIGDSHELCERSPQARGGLLGHLVRRWQAVDVHGRVCPVSEMRTSTLTYVEQKTPLLRHHSTEVNCIIGLLRGRRWALDPADNLGWVAPDGIELLVAGRRCRDRER